MMYLHIVCTILLFFIGLCGVLLGRRNLILTIMSIELMILSSNMLFAFFSILLDDITGQVFMFYILSIAAAETAIGLYLVIAYYRSYRYI